MLSDLATNPRGDVQKGPINCSNLDFEKGPVYLLKESSLEMCWVMVNGNFEGLMSDCKE